MARARGDEMADPIEIITLSDSESVDDSKPSKGRRGGEPRTFVAKLQALRERSDYGKRVFLLGNGDNVAGRHLTIQQAKPIIEKYFNNNVVVISRTVELKNKWDETDLVVQLGKLRATSGFAKGNDRDFKDHPNFHLFDAAAIDELEKVTGVKFVCSKQNSKLNYGRGGGAQAGGGGAGSARKRAASNASLSPKKRARGVNAGSTGGGRMMDDADRDAKLRHKLDCITAYVRTNKPRCPWCKPPSKANYLFPVKVVKKNSIMLGCAMHEVTGCKYFVPPPAMWVDIGSMILSDGES